MTIEDLKLNRGANLPSAQCGPSLRLTPSAARDRKMNVREGFDTYIRFQISNPSQKCDRLDDVNTYCRSRGADGLAFDYYENHVSVQTRGFRFNISANHSYSLATTNRIPDLTDGIHTVRIKYDPNFDENAVPHPSFQANGYSSFFLSNADFSNGGEGDWGTGVGLLYVYLDDMYSPVITTPINLGSTLELDDGRACVHPEEYSHYMRTNAIWGKGQDSTESWQEGTEGFCTFC
eukprot:gene23312-31642_t